MSINKAQADLIEAKNLLYELEYSLESKVNEISAAKEEISALKEKLKNHKYYKHKVKSYKDKLKEASAELQHLNVQYNSKRYIITFRNANYDRRKRNRIDERTRTKN